MNDQNNRRPQFRNQVHETREPSILSPIGAERRSKLRTSSFSFNLQRFSPEPSPILGPHSSSAFSSSDDINFVGSPQPSRDFGSRNSLDDTFALTPIRGRGRPITGRHHFSNQSRDHGNLSPRRQLFPEPVVEPPGFPSWQNLVVFNNNAEVGVRQSQPRTNHVARCSRECKFCKNNGEARSVYLSHVLRNPETGQLICPVLRAHVCETCGKTGDEAHTRNYCPVLKAEKRLKYALPVTLKMTKRQSDGQYRQP